MINNYDVIISVAELRFDLYNFGSTLGWLRQTAEIQRSME